MKKLLKVVSLKHPAGYSVRVLQNLAIDHPYVYVQALEGFQVSFSNGMAPISIAVVGQIDLCQQDSLIYEIYGKRSDYTGIV